MARARHLWTALAQAPWLPIVAYLGLLGAVALSTGDGIAPATIRDTLPHWLVIAWTAAVATGGWGAAIGGLTTRTRLESAGLGLLGSGAAIYGACVTAAAWPHGATVIAVSLAVLSMCLIRMRVLTLARRGQAEADRIHRDD